MKLRHKVPRSQELVFEYLSDMQKFKLVHPIIYSILELKKNNFKVKERLVIGGIPFTSGYLVTVNSNKADGIIQMNAVVKRLIKIEITFTLSSQGAYTVVDEIILFKSVLPIQSMLEKVFLKYHTQLFENIAQCND